MSYMEAQLANHIADILFFFIIVISVICFTLYKIISKIVEYKKSKMTIEKGDKNVTRRISKNGNEVG